MSLEKLFKSAVAQLRDRNVPFAVAGGFAADLYRHQLRSTKDVNIVVEKLKGSVEGVDILLSSLPWVPGAINRAESNLVDFGFGPVPALTLEDVILSKLYALGGATLRAKDIDDLQSVYEAGHTIDEAYLSGRIQELEITIPRTARPLLPGPLLALAK